MIGRTNRQLFAYTETVGFGVWVCLASVQSKYMMTVIEAYTNFGSLFECIMNLPFVTKTVSVMKLRSHQFRRK